MSDLRRRRMYPLARKVAVEVFARLDRPSAGASHELTGKGGAQR